MSDMAPGFDSQQYNNCSAVSYLSERQKHMCEKSERVLDVSRPHFFYDMKQVKASQSNHNHNFPKDHQFRGQAWD
jgi:hypothetical protein